MDVALSYVIRWGARAAIYRRLSQSKAIDVSAREVVAQSQRLFNFVARQLPRTAGDATVRPSLGSVLYGFDVEQPHELGEAEEAVATHTPPRSFLERDAAWGRTHTGRKNHTVATAGLPQSTCAHRKPADNGTDVLVQG